MRVVFRDHLGGFSSARFRKRSEDGCGGVYTGSIAFYQWPSGGQAGPTTTTVMLNCVCPNRCHGGTSTLIPFFVAVEIDDGQLQSTSEGNTLSAGENFMTGFIW